MALDFKERVALTLLARGATIGLGLVSSIVTARFLGPDGRGVLAALSVLTGLALQFGGMLLQALVGLVFLRRLTVSLKQASP